MSSSDFRLIRPIAMTDAILDSSTIPEAVAATYSGATTYAAGALAGPAPVTGQAQLIWKSLQSSNTGNAQVEGAWWTYVASVYPAYAGGTTYAANDYAQDNTNHKIYKSIAGGNLGNALTDATKWAYISYTNTWKMFDSAYNSISEQYNQIVMVLSPGELVSAVSLLNTTAASVRVEQ